MDLDDRGSSILDIDRAGGSTAEATSAWRVRPGRPRDPRRTEHLLCAARSALADAAGDLTIDTLAAVAGVGKASIYRRWPTLPDLFIAAVVEIDPLPARPPAGTSTRDQLMSLAAHLWSPLTDGERALSGALCHPGSGAALRTAALRAVLEPLRERAREVHPPGEEASESTEALLAVLEALWIRRLIVVDGSWPAVEPELLVDAVLMPLLGGAASAARRGPDATELASPPPEVRSARGQGACGR